MNSKGVSDVAYISELFRRKKLPRTGKWIDFARNSPMKDADFFLNLEDALNTLRNEIGNYKREYYDNPSFKRNVFDLVLGTVLTSMRAAGRARFHKLTTELIPIALRNIEASKMLVDFVDSTKDMKRKQRFFMSLFYYLIFFEVYLKDVLKTLLAMRRLSEGKAVDISEALEVLSDEKVENSYDDVAPDALKTDIHRHLRNSIAHAYFTYLENEDKMQFWDINPRKNEYSMKPTKLSYEELSRYSAQILFFSDTYGLITLLLMAFDNLRNAREKNRRLNEPHHQ
jgi:hypothetical protein